MATQKECARCNSPWEWDSVAVHDFNIPTAKRVWPAVCTQCRTELEQGYKEKKITRKELDAEFSSISARAAKKSARSPGEVADILRMMRNFEPRRRGK